MDLALYCKGPVLARQVQQIGRCRCCLVHGLCGCLQGYLLFWLCMCNSIKLAEVKSKLKGVVINKYSVTEKHDSWDVVRKVQNATM